MVFISEAILTEFWIKHPDSIPPLNDWWKKTKKSNRFNFQDVKAYFNSVDYVGNDRYVFNIKGNRYRLDLMIFFDIRTIFIRFFGTLAEYEAISCSKI